MQLVPLKEMLLFAATAAANWSLPRIDAELRLLSECRTNFLLVMDLHYKCSRAICDGCMHTLTVRTFLRARFVLL